MGLPNVLLLTGLAGAGKSTIAEALAERHGYERGAFASPIKRMLSVLGLTDQQLRGGWKDTVDLWYEVTPRHMMQTLGTEWGRRLIHPDIWVIGAVKWTDEKLSNGVKVIFDDVRFPNEIARMRERFPDTVVIEIVPGFPGYETKGAGHSSEGQELDVDFSIVNDGSVDVAVQRVERVLGRRESPTNE